jgi:lipopolysaccharide transport system permease protein
MATETIPSDIMDDTSLGPVTINKATNGLPPLNLKELWIYRYLLVYIIRRDVVVRYKQTVFGLSWAAINPLITMVVFSFVFGTVLSVNTYDIPYPLYSFTALVPWTLFAKGLSNSAVSVQSNSNIITKIYFPRIIAPISAFANSFIDFVISFAVLLLMLFGYLILSPDALADVTIFHTGILTPLWLLMFTALAILVGLGLGFWFSSLQVRMRDINYILPFVLQIGQYVSPVAYPSAFITEQFGPVLQFIYGLNPLVTTIDGFRWVFFDLPLPPAPMFIASVMSAFVIFLSGLYFFRYSEPKFVDYL